MAPIWGRDNPTRRLRRSSGPPMPSQSDKARIEVLTLAATISAAREGSYVGHDCRGRGHSRSSCSARPRLKGGARVVLRSGTGNPALRSDGGGLQPPCGRSTPKSLSARTTPQPYTAARPEISTISGDANFRSRAGVPERSNGAISKCALGCRSGAVPLRTQKLKISTAPCPLRYRRVGVCCAGSGGAGGLVGDCLISGGSTLLHGL